MLIEIDTISYFKPGKQILGITRPAIVRCKHTCGHGLAKSARPADADISLQCIHYLIGILDQTGFVYIDFRINAFCKTFYSLIQISAHLCLLHYIFAHYK